MNIFLPKKADVVDVWCSSGKACLAHGPGAVISFLCALCVRSCGCICLLTASKLTQRTPRPQRRQLSFFQTPRRLLRQVINDSLSPKLVSKPRHRWLNRSWVQNSGYLFPLGPLREILLLPLVHHRLQAHAKDAKAAKKALSFCRSRRRRPVMFLGRGLSGS